MKTVKLIGMALLMGAFTACAQTGQDVPGEVRASFAKKFPDAKKIKWDRENESEWEAEFRMDGKEFSANFATDGTWKETEYEIRESEIPSPVKSTIDREFAGYEIEEVEVCETPDGMVYEFMMEQDEADMEVAISPEGLVIKKEVKSEDEEGEKDEDD